MVIEVAFKVEGFGWFQYSMVFFEHIAIRNSNRASASVCKSATHQLLPKSLAGVWLSDDDRELEFCSIRVFNRPHDPLDFGSSRGRHRSLTPTPFVGRRRVLFSWQSSRDRANAGDRRHRPVLRADNGSPSSDSLRQFRDFKCAKSIPGRILAQRPWIDMQSR